jgi:hypothetical protein
MEAGFGVDGPWVGNGLVQTNVGEGHERAVTRRAQSERWREGIEGVRAGPHLPPPWVQHAALDIQQRQVLLPARTDRRAADSGQEDRLTPAPRLGRQGRRCPKLS